MANVIEMTGNRYGRLTVTHRVPSHTNRHARWAVLCDCGNTTEIDGYVLRQGRSNSCGCRAKPEGSPLTPEGVENAESNGHSSDS